MKLFEKIFDRNLTNRSIETIHEIMELTTLRSEVNDVVMGLHEAGLFKKVSMVEGTSNIFGVRSKKPAELSMIMKVIDRLATENKRLENEVFRLQGLQFPSYEVKNQPNEEKQH